MLMMTEKASFEAPCFGIRMLGLVGQEFIEYRISSQEQASF
jgi:hypothetical protein